MHAQYGQCYKQVGKNWTLIADIHVNNLTQFDIIQTSHAWIKHFCITFLEILEYLSVMAMNRT